MSAPSPTPHWSEARLRSVSLAQAIEQADTAHTLVSPVELEEATQRALAQARARGVQRVGLADCVVDRADAIVERASARDAAVAALRSPRWLGWARGLPVVALLLGLVLDRIANAHRVDLLSPPLLAVLLWNVAVYTLLLWQAVRRPALPSPWLPGLGRVLAHWRVPGAGRGGRGLSARIAAQFQALWWARTQALQVQRLAWVLHGCAAAWGAGIALSLLLRGLVVRYQFGWESTFLDAAQVHAIVSVLFAPLTWLLGLEPFTLQDIAAAQNFAGEGTAGNRWVWMYVGLLLLVVVLPRLALAVWAYWRAARWQGRIDLDDAAFDALRASLPGDVVVGLHGPQAQALQGVQTAQGDRLRFAAAAEPVDAVLSWGSEALPPAWQSAPCKALPWAAFGASWVLEPALFDLLDQTLPAHRHALVRLRTAWVQRNEQHFDQSLQALAQHLHACARFAPGDASGAYAQQVHTLDTALRALHGQPPAPPSQAAVPLPTPRRADGAALTLGASAGAAAGAAAGAKVGALIDVGTGGLTLGAGTALGALLGGSTAWALRSFQKKDENQQDLLRHMAEAACTHYLAIAHQQRVPPGDAPALAERWRAEVTGTVAAHGEALAAALKEGPGSATLQALLRTMLMGILQRSFAV